MIERFKQMRKALNLTLEDVGKKIGTTHGAVGNWERLGKIPTDRLYQIAEAFGVSYEWLRTGEGDMMGAERKSLKDFTNEELAFEIFRRLYEKLTPDQQRDIDKFIEKLAQDSRYGRSGSGTKVETNIGTLNGTFNQNNK